MIKGHIWLPINIGCDYIQHEMVQLVNVSLWKKEIPSEYKAASCREFLKSVVHDILGCYVSYIAHKAANFLLMFPHKKESSLNPKLLPAESCV